MSDISLGIIGAGNIAKEHLKVIRAMDGVRAVGITSRTLSKAKKLANTSQIEQVYDTVDHLLKGCAPDGIMVLVSANQIYDVAVNLIPVGTYLLLSAELHAFRHAATLPKYSTA